MPKRKKHSDSVKFAAVGIGVLFLVAVLLMTGMIPGLPKLQTGYPPGWEISDRACALGYANATVTPQNPYGTGNHIFTKASEFTTPNFVSYPLWQVDLDAVYYNLPTVMIELGEVHHVGLDGKDSPNNEPAKVCLPVTRGNDTFYMDYHIYLYTVTIRTIADVKQIGMAGTLGNLPNFQHETSAPYSCGNWLDSGIVPPGAVGEPFTGGAYVKFIISPWTGYSYRSPPNSSYVLQGAWAGIMNTYIWDEAWGRIEGPVENQFPPSGDNPGGKPTPDANSPLMDKGAIDPGHQVPMFYDDGSFGNLAPVVDWDSGVTPDTRIESTVVQYFPVALFPGCKAHFNGWGIVDALYPADGYVQYTARIDVLQTHDFVLQTAYKPPTPFTPSDYFTWAQDFWVGVLAGLDPFKMFGPLEPFVWFLFTIGVFLLIVFVLLAVFAPWVLPRIFKGVTSAGKAVREVTKKDKGG